MRTFQDTTPGLSVIMEDMRAIVAAMGEEVQKLAGKTVLLTGASGMLSAYLADAVAYFNQTGLLASPTKLLLLARRPVRPGDRIGHLLGRPDVAFIVQDACMPLSVEGPLHFIVHAASAASPRWYRQDPVGTVDANSVALRQLLELSRHRDTESFLYFSSSEVYGSPEPEHIPTPETYLGRVEFTGRRACYMESKRFGETLCGAFHEQYGAPVKVVRPFHIHGPGLRLDDGRIVAEMIGKGLRGEPFELLSDGSATRTYGYISDATVGFLKVLLSDCQGETFNVGADTPELPILELVRVIARLFDHDKPVKINVQPQLEYLKDAPQRVCPDLTKIRTRLSYAPTFPLEAGLEQTIRWHRERMEAR